MTSKITRRPKFVQDLRDVWLFISKDSSDRADDFVVELEKLYHLLASSPFLGVSRFPNYPDLRMFPFRNYLVIYEPLAEGTGID